MYKYLPKLNRKHLLLAASIFLIIFTQKEITMTNAASRFLTMDSIVKRESLIITEGHFYTDDKFKSNGDYYSSKPPLLSAIGAGLYYPLHLLGYSLPENPYDSADNLPVYLITLILVGGSYLALIYFFYKFCELLGLSANRCLALSFGLMVGTLYFTYSITLNNHTIAGSLLFISFYLLFKQKIKKNPSGSYTTIAGFLAAMAAAIEIQTGALFFVIFLIYTALLFRPKYLVVYCLGAFLPATLHFYLNYQITGTLFPIQLLAEHGIGLPGIIPHKVNIFLYIFNITVGTHGLLLYSPILLLAFYGIFQIIRNKYCLLYRESVLVGCGFLALFIFYVSKIRYYSGAAYGFRWFIAIVPLLYMFTAYIFLEPGKSIRKYFSTLLIISFIVAEIGIVRPWSPSMVRIYNPITKEQMRVQFPLLANLRIIKNRVFHE